MKRATRASVGAILFGAGVCLAVGAAVAFTPLADWLPVRGWVPPEVPASWAALPPDGRVEIALVDSEQRVAAIAAGLSGAEVALDRPGGVALVDGRVFAVGSAAARQLVRGLSWDGLPAQVRQTSAAEIEVFRAPAPASLTWQARRRAYAAATSVRDLAAARPAFVLASTATAVVLLLRAALAGGPALRRRRRERPEEPSPWRRRRAENPVRVVLVPDEATLAQVRIAIGEENIVAAAEHAFAFADGWILAVRKGSVFELMSELGWRMRPLEMATRQELVGEGHALSEMPADDDGDTLALLEALRVCGPVSHGTVPRIATSAAARA